MQGSVPPRAPPAASPLPCLHLCTPASPLRRPRFGAGRLCLHRVLCRRAGGRPLAAPQTHDCPALSLAVGTGKEAALHGPQIAVLTTGFQRVRTRAWLHAELPRPWFSSSAPGKVRLPLPNSPFPVWILFSSQGCGSGSWLSYQRTFRKVFLGSHTASAVA